MYISTAPGLIGSINQSLQKNDLTEIANQIHGFKTKWIMMGMNESRDLALKIEQQCREGNHVEILNTNIRLLISHIEKASEELKVIVSGHMA